MENKASMISSSICSQKKGMLMEVCWTPLHSKSIKKLKGISKTPRKNISKTTESGWTWCTSGGFPSKRGFWDGRPMRNNVLVSLSGICRLSGIERKDLRMQTKFFDLLITLVIWGFGGSLVSWVVLVIWDLGLLGFLASFAWIVHHFWCFA